VKGCDPGDDNLVFAMNGSTCGSGFSEGCGFSDGTGGDDHWVGFYGGGHSEGEGFGHGGGDGRGYDEYLLTGAI
jgi:hypothetical protein